MKPFLRCLVILISSTFSIALAQSEQRVTSIDFYGTQYTYRWSQGDQFEFTPEGQEDLTTWSDMITVWRYPQATNAEGLASVANTVLGTYQSNISGKVLKTDSVPATPDTPAEHFISVVVGDARFLEFAVIRLVLVDGQGIGVIYSHRIYGEDAGPDVSQWLEQNGVASEQTLMQLNVSEIAASIQE
jgi:hypothetical protein